MKNVKVKNSSPSLGRIYRERAVPLHQSCSILPAQAVKDKAGVVHTIPARVSKGLTYFKEGSAAWLRAGGGDRNPNINS